MDIRDPRERAYERGGLVRDHVEYTESEGNNSSENVLWCMSQARSSVEQRREAEAERERRGSRASSSDATRRDEIRSEVGSQRESEGSARTSGEGSKRSYTSGAAPSGERRQRLGEDRSRGSSTEPPPKKREPGSGLYLANNPDMIDIPGRGKVNREFPEAQAYLKKLEEEEAKKATQRDADRLQRSYTGPEGWDDWQRRQDAPRPDLSAFDGGSGGSRDDRRMARKRQEEEDQKGERKGGGWSSQHSKGKGKGKSSSGWGSGGQDSSWSAKGRGPEWPSGSGGGSSYSSGARRGDSSWRW